MRTSPQYYVREDMVYSKLVFYKKPIEKFYIDYDKDNYWKEILDVKKYQRPLKNIRVKLVGSKESIIHGVQEYWPEILYITNNARVFLRT